MTSSGSTRDLARVLVILESRDSRLVTPNDIAGRIWSKLCTSIVRFAGQDGFLALARRALKLAGDGDSTIGQLELQADGTLLGTESLSSEATLVLLNAILGVLVSLVGERLTWRLMVVAWPELKNEDLNSQ